MSKRLRVKKIFWLVGGLCAAGAGFLAWSVRRSGQVEDLAQRGDEAEPEETHFDELHADEEIE